MPVWTRPSSLEERSFLVIYAELTLLGATKRGKRKSLEELRAPGTCHLESSWLGCPSFWDGMLTLDSPERDHKACIFSSAPSSACHVTLGDFLIPTSLHFLICKGRGLSRGATACLAALAVSPTLPHLSLAQKPNHYPSAFPDRTEKLQLRIGFLPV